MDPGRPLTALAPPGRSRLLALLLAFLGAAGCGPGPGTDVDAGSDASPGAADARPADSGNEDAPPAPENAAVFAHSASALYRIDPDTLQVMHIGAFQWPGDVDSMTDIAIDENGRMLGVSYTAVYQVDPDTAACTFLSTLSEGEFNGLSFVPAPGDPDTEILLGAGLLGDVYEINPDTGAATLRGNYGNGYFSSGDIVSVRGAGTLATVTTGSGNDLLATIDPQDGYRATIIGNTGYIDIWGLGYWGGQVYGFTDNNQFLLIDVTTGQGQVVETGAVEWWGAGVTTTAPIVQ